MKLLVKFSLLFALILTGRYMQSVAPTTSGLQRKPPMALFTPITPTLTHYTNYSDTTATLAIPVNQRKQASLTFY